MDMSIRYPGVLPPRCGTGCHWVPRGPTRCPVLGRGEDDEDVAYDRACVHAVEHDEVEWTEGDGEGIAEGGRAVLRHEGADAVPGHHNIDEIFNCVYRR
eukprot:gene11666-biopygen413